MGTLADGVGVSGGGASAVSISDPLTVSESRVPFGMETYEFTPENADGSLDTQAGSHPFQLTTTNVLNADAETVRPGQLGAVAQPALAEGSAFRSPAWSAGQPDSRSRNVQKRCSIRKSVRRTRSWGWRCSRSVSHWKPRTTMGLYNLPPAPGEPARFGFHASGIPVFLDTAVRTGGRLWCDGQRGQHHRAGPVRLRADHVLGCPGRSTSRPLPSRSRVRITIAFTKTCHRRRAVQKTRSRAPFLALPTLCGESFASSIYGDSWSAPGKPSERQEPLLFTLHDADNPKIALDGCDGLAFEPSIKVTPNGEAGSSPSGLNVDVHVPQSSILVPNGDAESDLKDITVALPEGVAVEPVGRGRAGSVLAGRDRLQERKSRNPRAGIHAGRTVVPGRVEDRDRDDPHAAVAEPAEGLRVPGLAAELRGAAKTRSNRSWRCMS